MPFHRTVMRNSARRLYGNGSMAAMWPGWRNQKWAARGCCAVAWTSKHQAKEKIARESAVAAVRRGRVNRKAILRRLIDGLVNQANGMAMMRAAR